MQTIEYRHADKSTWGRGPWLTEPDKKQWQDQATGVPCLAVRNHSGAWCGYVGVPPGHPAHGKDYDSVDVEVHGGLTFADKCADASPDSWARLQKRLRDAVSEARQYPKGDAAQLIQRCTAAGQDYDTFVEYVRAHHICHLPEPGEPDDVWWFGFDCAHFGDCSPAYDNLLRDGEYRTLEYVEHEVGALARQLAALAPRRG